MEMVGNPILLFDTESESKREARVRESTRKRSGEKDVLVCAYCGHPITLLMARMAVGGSHEHRFVNPVGLAFKIGCFSEAKGCRCVGERTVENTWFAGYQWQIALCASCRTHLGWHYASSESAFFGLILRCLV